MVLAGAARGRAAAVLSAALRGKSNFCNGLKNSCNEEKDREKKE